MYEVKMPRLGVTMQNGTVNNWLVEEGEEVTKGDYLFELETEKSTLEIEAQESGVLRKVIVPDGEEVPVNTILAILAAPDESVDLSVYTQNERNSVEVDQVDEPQEDKPKEPSQNSRRGGVVPKARKLAKELSIPLESVTGTGKGGVITANDVRNATRSKVSSSLKVKETIPLNHVKKAMSENILNSWKTIPQFTQMVSVNMENVLKIKKELADVSLNDIILKTIGNAVKYNSIVNSKLEENNHITVYDEVNISVAVNSAQGLVVPVLKNVEAKSVSKISEEVKVLAEKAEMNRLTPEDYADGTITISNLGSAGIEAGTPIVNSPQSTIVFVGAIQKVPIVNGNNEIVIAPIMTISICYDHRFIDGATGAQFTNEVKNYLEELKVEDLM